MVKIGFIVEGPSDARIIRSENFVTILAENDLELVDIIVPEGKTHFFHPHAQLETIRPKVESYIKRLEDKGAEKILFLVDLDNEPCYTSVRSKIPHRPTDSVIICKIALEAWYLADTNLMSAILSGNHFTELPEEIENPFDEIKNLLLERTESGVGNKIILANKVIKNGFSIVNSAAHPQCPSARYFIEKLQSFN